MHILITGGAGFIGSRLAQLAVQQSIDVTVLDDLSTGYRENLDDLPVRFVHGSVADPEIARDCVTGVDSVVHLAALGSVPRSIEDPPASHHANNTGTLTLLEGSRAAGVRHVVTASSSSVYGLNGRLPKDESDWVRPLSPYAVTKLAAEQYTLAYQQSFGLQTLAFRFFNVYGPGQRGGHAYAAVIPTFLEALLHGRSLPVHGDGSQTRDFTYVDTVCGALLRAVAERASHPLPINLAFGTNTSINELVRLISDLCDSPVAVEHCPARPGDVQHSSADNTSLQTLFPGLCPVPLDQGLAETMKWFGIAS